MALFHNFGVNQRDFLCDVHLYTAVYVSVYTFAQSLDFLKLVNPDSSGLNWKLVSVQI